MNWDLPSDMLRLISTELPHGTWGANEILPGLYLGTYMSALDHTALESLNIGLVVRIIDDSEIGGSVGATATIHFNDTCPNVKYRGFSIGDLDQSEIDIINDVFNVVKDDIAETLSQGKGVLVHCVWGMSRSVSVVLAYVMWSQKMTCTEAYEYVKSKRSCIRIRPGWISQLQRYALQLQYM